MLAVILQSYQGFCFTSLFRYLLLAYDTMKLSFVLLAVAVSVANGLELKKLSAHKPHQHPVSPAPTPATGEQKDAADDSSSDCKLNVLSKKEIRQIVQDEIAAASDVKPVLPPAPAYVNANGTGATNNGTFLSTILTLTDKEGRQFDYDPNEATYRDIPSSMCSASVLSSSTASNQAAFVATHNSLRSQLNSCAWKVPKPSPPLGPTISSAVLATQADTYTQYLKNNQNCGLVHSSQAQRTVTFKLDNGTQVTNGYLGENLYYQSLCLSVGDTGNFNTYQAKYCAPNYLYTQAANSWWNEISIYSKANGGNFMTQSQLNAATGANEVGHWTQMAWGWSTVIAGAAAECTSVSTQTFSCSPPGLYGCSASGTISINARCYSWVVTGRYYPGGNYIGQNPYSTDGTICSPTSG